MIVVSHDFDTVRDLCPRAVWLDHGLVRMDGEFEAVLDAYRAEQG
jgi:ABC-type polysaccharide/polyol phosphate transport system ATPase subunit